MYALNRLSDTLFVLARWILKKEGKPELLWQRDQIEHKE
jgi:cob(I)alamin adenosyltransferase